MYADWLKKDILFLISYIRQRNVLYKVYSEKGGEEYMFEIPLIVEAVDTTDINDMAGGQYADSMSWTGDCCYGK